MDGGLVVRARGLEYGGPEFKSLSLYLKPETELREDRGLSGCRKGLKTTVPLALALFSLKPSKTNNKQHLVYKSHTVDVIPTYKMCRHNSNIWLCRLNSNLCVDVSHGSHYSARGSFAHPRYGIQAQHRIYPIQWPGTRAWTRVCGRSASYAVEGRNFHGPQREAAWLFLTVFIALTGFPHRVFPLRPDVRDLPTAPRLTASCQGNCYIYSHSIDYWVTSVAIVLNYIYSHSIEIELHL